MSLRYSPSVARLTPYAPGLSAQDVASEFGISPSEVVKLGSGENPFGPSPAAARAISEDLGSLNRYPEWTSAELRCKVAGLFDVSEEEVVCGAGETEIISCVIRAFAHRPALDRGRCARRARRQLSAAQADPRASRAVQAQVDVYGQTTRADQRAHPGGFPHIPPQPEREGARARRRAAGLPGCIPGARRNGRGIHTFLRPDLRGAPPSRMPPTTTR